MTQPTGIPQTPKPLLSSDALAGMRPDFEAVASREGFTLLSIPMQFAALVDAVAVDHPTKAA